MSRRTTFTLVELLIIISIIAVLASLLLPALRMAKLKAQSIQCMNNLRTIGQAFSLYSSDNDDFFPATGPTWGGLAYSTVYWQSALAVYLGKGWKPIFLCPNATSDPNLGACDSYQASQVTTVNSYAKSRPLSNVRAGSVRDISNRLLAIDIYNTYVSGWESCFTFDLWYASWRHSKRMNALWADMHLAAASPLEDRTKKKTYDDKN